MEELGRSAFGKVHKGVLRELPKTKIFFQAQGGSVQIYEELVVAIKVLLGE